MTHEYFETGYVDDLDEIEREILEDEMPDEPEYIAAFQENWIELREAQEDAKRYDAWVADRFIGTCERAIRQHESVIRKIQALAPGAGYSTQGLLYLAVELFDFPFVQQTLSGIDDETLQKILEHLQKELAEKADRMALRMSTANLAPLEAARKAS